MNHIFFYATGVDIGPALQELESNADLKYVEIGKKSTSQREIYLSHKDIPNLGLATHESGGASKSFLVSLRKEKNRVFTFSNKQGESRWLLSNGDNKNTVILKPAGLWRTGTLLPGTMTTLHDTNTAQKLMQWFLTALQRQGFKMIDVWWLGPQAQGLLKSGRRLAQAEQSPPELDLKLPASFA